MIAPRGFQYTTRGLTIGGKKKGSVEGNLDKNKRVTSRSGYGKTVRKPPCCNVSFAALQPFGGIDMDKISENQNRRGSSLTSAGGSSRGTGGVTKTRKPNICKAVTVAAFSGKKTGGKKAKGEVEEEKKGTAKGGRKENEARVLVQPAQGQLKKHRRRRGLHPPC